MQDLGFLELKLEVSDITKDGACAFEDYDPNWAYLRVWTWQHFLEVFHPETENEAEIDFDSMAVEQKPAELLRFDTAEDTVGSLTALLAEKYGVEASELCILVRHEPIMSGEVRIEHFNYDLKKFEIDKKLS